MTDWERIDDGSIVTESGFRTIIHKQFRMNNGAVMKADIMDHQGSEAALMIALTPDNQIVIARQYRSGPERMMDEMPGGTVDPGEEPEQAARRELIEEVGYEAEEVEYVGSAHVNAWSNSLHHYYLARNCRKIGANNPEEFEEIEVKTVTIDEFFENARAGRMTDVQGVFLAHDKLKEINSL